MDIGPKTSAANGAQSASERLNQACFCITLDRDALARALEQEVGDPDFHAAFISTRPHLFSDASVFISRSQASEMLRIVRAIEAATGLAGYQDMALSGTGVLDSSFSPVPRTSSRSPRRSTLLQGASRRSRCGRSAPRRSCVPAHAGCWTQSAMTQLRTPDIFLPLLLSSDPKQ